MVFLEAATDAEDRDLLAACGVAVIITTTIMITMVRAVSAVLEAALAIGRAADMAAAREEVPAGEASLAAVPEEEVHPVAEAVLPAVVVRVAPAVQASQEAPAVPLGAAEAVVPVAVEAPPAAAAPEDIVNLFKISQTELLPVGRSSVFFGSHLRKQIRPNGREPMSPAFDLFYYCSDLKSIKWYIIRVH